MHSSRTQFGSDQLLDSLGRLPTPRKFWVGFSGGADSTALLQALYECRDRLPSPIQVVHFHHGLQFEADAWQEHCCSFCSERDLPFLTENLVIDTSGKCSIEEASRNSRYRAVAALLGPEEMYLTAHHAEDLAETLFLNLMRGSGIEGLAGIPVLRSLDRGWVARPLLDMRRSDLEAYLEQRGIGWLNDPSNTDTTFDRNFLRQQLFPKLEQRWPGLVQRLSRTARNARITASAMASFIESQAGDLIRDPLKMPLHRLQELDPQMQTLILRQWLRRHEVPVLPEQRLREFLGQLSGAGPENRAEVHWDDWVIRHHRFNLWLQRSKPQTNCPRTPWQQGMQLDLGPDLGLLKLHGQPVDIPRGWLVRSRQPADRIRTHSQGSSQKLKHFFQSASIPPWLRNSIPVLEWDREPVALGDWIIGHRLQDWLRENGLKYCWEPAGPALMRLRSDCR